MYRSKSKKLENTIDEYVASKAEIKRIKMEAEAEREKLKEAQERVSIGESAQKTQELMDKFDHDLKEMQRKHDKALQDKMNEHFLHTARHKKEVSQKDG